MSDDLVIAPLEKYPNTLTCVELCEAIRLPVFRELEPLKQDLLVDHNVIYQGGIGKSYAPEPRNA